MTPIVGSRKHRLATGTIVGLVLAATGCGGCSKAKTDDGADPKVTTLGSIEVTAELSEVVPYDDRVTFPPNDNYDYVYIFKYRVLRTHRGKVDGETIYVGQYNPLKARSEAADARAEGIGGSVKRFKAGDVHRLALEVPLDDHYMGGIVNKYHGKIDPKTPLYWAVWTNQVVR
ncbi:MAG: hypothetical protein JXQ73_17390 [Phycisphaerae bacterium]|nr:hypothetical protein [Phycisphaerae bacterium]